MFDKSEHEKVKARKREQHEKFWITSWDQDSIGSELIKIEM